MPLGVLNYELWTFVGLWMMFCFGVVLLGQFGCVGPQSPEAITYKLKEAGQVSAAGNPSP